MRASRDTLLFCNLLHLIAPVRDSPVVMENGCKIPLGHKGDDISGDNSHLLGLGVGLAVLSVVSCFVLAAIQPISASVSDLDDLANRQSSMHENP